MRSILTITLNPTIDVSSSVPNVFPEHKLRCGPARNEAGGGGLNVARALKHLGADSLALHFCGGPTGSVLRALLDAEGVRHQSVPIKAWTRQSIIITETATGQQYRFVMRGPTLAEEEWRLALDLVSEMKELPELIVASGSLPAGVPADFYGELARRLHGRNVRLLLDTSGSALAAALGTGVFLIKPSLRELRALSGEELVHETEQDAAAVKIVNKGGAEVVLVSLGAAGVLLASSTGCERMRAPTVPVQSKVGAGDSMLAGVTLGLASGYSMRDAVRLGIAAGTAAVMTGGTELCRREDVARLFDQIS